MAEGISFETGYVLGGNLSIADVRSQFDAVVLAIGAECPRDVNVPGDDDGATNGQIQTKLYFTTSAEFGRVTGAHLFRLSSPADFPYGSKEAGSRYQGQRGPTPSRAHLNFRRTDTRR